MDKQLSSSCQTQQSESVHQSKVFEQGHSEAQVSNTNIRRDFASATPVAEAKIF